MKFDNYQFPHPVLTSQTDDISGKPFFEEKIIEKNDCYTISINYKTNNDFLEDLITNSLAVIICEYTCSGTVYRDSAASSGNSVSFDIQKEDVRGKVEFYNYLVAKQDIMEYSNPNAHPDYYGFTFDIERGDVLAYFGSFSFNAAINYKKLKSVSSFLRIEERADIKLAQFDIDGERITVRLPKKDYNVYTKHSIAKKKDFVPIFHSSIVFSALIFALQNIDNHRDRMWAHVINTRLDEVEFEGLSMDNESGDLVEIAQILLGNPISRLLSGLEEISEKF
jgi:hypothetical protein